MTLRADTHHAELERLIRELRELVEALDRRLPQVERSGEATIAKAALVLRDEAIARIAELERELRA